MDGRCWKAVVGLAICAAMLTAVGTVEAQKTRGKARPATTKYLMRGVTQPQCKALGDLLKAGPSDDKGWETVACQASILNELGYQLMDDGRCPDGTWAGATRSLRDGGAAVLAAAEARDLEAARAGFKALTTSCAACHKAHKK